MDLGEMPTGIESPLIPVLLWTVIGVITLAGVVVTSIAARRGRQRGLVLTIGAGLLLVAVGVGLVMANRYDLATQVDGAVCPHVPDGDSYMGFYVVYGEIDAVKALSRSCFRLQYDIVAGALAALALATVAGGTAQLLLSRRASPTP